ncbi:hypothetical protein Nepgr_010365 [Nepenthes gracilis]|uniref:Uncharacterized protein n=1 Tax=Nepenthes gracilis TaxID=150966 RepID=A0AAD3SCB5_NEPGR|nr:hypothetical protein Nepgr_010365 [Nepenthes gracilis]
MALGANFSVIALTGLETFWFSEHGAMDRGLDCDSLLKMDAEDGRSAGQLVDRQKGLMAHNGRWWCPNADQCADRKNMGRSTR